MKLNYVFSADWHINLRKKNIPKSFQINRLNLLVNKLNDMTYDTLFIGGDIFDHSRPTVEELAIYFQLISRLNKPTVIFSGNHEMMNKKVSVLDHLAYVTNEINPLVSIVRENEDYTAGFECIPDTLKVDIVNYHSIHNIPTPKNKVCLTHVRGAIPPHVEPEIDLNELSGYKLVVSGDLHSHTNSQGNIVYPGSPFSTAFHRDRVSGSYGLVLFNSEGEYDWVELDLPQLIRKTIDVGEEMVPGDVDHIIYEVEGSIGELATLERNELLDKTITKLDVWEVATLDLSKKTFGEELSLYFSSVLNLDNTTTGRLISKIKEVHPNVEDM